MKKFLSVFVGVVLVSFAAGAQEKGQGRNLFDGYPLCQAVFHQWLTSNLDYLGYTVADDPDALQIVKEFSHLQIAPGRQPIWEDQPEHPVDHPRNPVSSGSCFVEDTSVLKLTSDNTEKGTPIHRRADVTIYDIDPGDFVLASLGAITQDPEYQSPCWARVRGVHVGMVTGEDALQIIHYKNNEGDDYTLEVTPKHRFFSQDQKHLWRWTTAHDLHTGNVLYECKGELCTVVASDQVVAAESPEGWWEKFLAPLTPTGTYKKYVFNLNTDVNTYYVGEEGGRVLVHNLK